LAEAGLLKAYVVKPLLLRRPGALDDDELAVLRKAISEIIG
jgi:hypothetical protein